MYPLKDTQVHRMDLNRATLNKSCCMLPEGPGGHLLLVLVLLRLSPQMLMVRTATSTVQAPAAMHIVPIMHLFARLAGSRPACHAAGATARC